MVSGARNTIVLTVVSLRRMLVCLLSTQCVLEEEGTSSGSLSTDQCASPRFSAMLLSAASAGMLLSETRQESVVTWGIMLVPDSGVSALCCGCAVCPRCQYACGF